MEHRDRTILKKVLSELQLADELMNSATLEDFLADEMRKRAVCMTVINIGELVKNLSDAFRKRSPQIPMYRDLFLD